MFTRGCGVQVIVCMNYIFNRGVNINALTHAINKKNVSR